MKKIKILGAGISGLTAAINLSRAGYKVEVFEKNPDCGMRFNGDMQGLENWSDEEDVLDSLAKMQIEVNFEATPFRKVSMTNCQETKDYVFDKPLFYLIKRGRMKESIDQGLKVQAQQNNVVINFNKTLEPIEADIVATGPQPQKNMSIIDKGIVFKTNLPDLAVAIVNDKAAFEGYSYLLVANNSACLCTYLFNGTKQLSANYEFTLKYFTKKYNLKIKDPKRVGGIFNFSIHNIYKRGKSRYVGEAAGLQDFLYGFGMRTAFRSGFLAAESIILRKDYNKIAKVAFQDYLKAGVVNRYNWEHTDNDNYTTLMQGLNRSEGTEIPRSIYNFNIAQRLEYPIALDYIKNKYPEIL